MSDFASLIKSSLSRQQERRDKEKKYPDIIEKAYPLPPDKIILPGDTPPQFSEAAKQSAAFIMSENPKNNTHFDISAHFEKPSPIKGNPNAIMEPTFEELLSRQFNRGKIPIRDGEFDNGKNKDIGQVAVIEERTAGDLPPAESGKYIQQVSLKPRGETEAPAGIEFDEYQLAALRGIKMQQFACLVGPAGCGKTTTEKALVKDLENEIPLVDLNLTRLENRRSNTKDLNIAVGFCAFTGRAVQQMKRALPKEYHPMCATIHSTLGYHPVPEVRLDKKTGQYKDVLVFRPYFTAANKLPYKAIVVDEAGMCPIYLWNQLLDALPSDCRIILIGDINQLPPVQGRSVLGFAMIKWPTFTLEKIHRQAADNPIIANAHRILRGEMPIPDGKHFGMKEIPDGSLSAFPVIKAVVIHAHKKGLFDPLKDGLIVPQNKGTLGQLNLNDSLRNYFNPGNRILIKTGIQNVLFSIGDKVMLLQNDNMRGLTNGMTGVVTDIRINPNFQGDFTSEQFRKQNANIEITATSLDDLFGDGKTDDDLDEKSEKNKEINQRQASHIMEVKFDVPTFDVAADIANWRDKIEAIKNSGTEFIEETVYHENTDGIVEEDIISYTIEDCKRHIDRLENQVPYELVEFQTAGQYRMVTHAYAFTCHKSQGGEYPTTIIVVHSANHIMLTREWLYTAVTRAQNRVILLYNKRGLAQALGTQRISGKTVKEKAEQFISLMDKADTTVPDLPEPKEV